MCGFEGEGKRSLERVNPAAFPCPLFYYSRRSSCNQISPAVAVRRVRPRLLDLEVEWRQQVELDRAVGVALLPADLYGDNAQAGQAGR